MAVTRQKTESKPGTFKKGNKAALGNDKTMRLSTWLDKALRDPATAEEYGEAMSQMQAISTDMVKQYWKAKSALEKKAVFDTLADRTEGKAQQKIDHTTLGKEMPQPIYGGNSLSTDTGENDG